MFMENEISKFHKLLASTQDCAHKYKNFMVRSFGILFQKKIGLFSNFGKEREFFD